jgi:hypothetical protein
MSVDWTLAQSESIAGSVAQAALLSSNGLEALEAHGQSISVRMVPCPAWQANVPAVQLFECF